MQTAEQSTASQAGETSEVEPSRIQQLEQELANTKEYLQSVIEKQEASNEELAVRERGDIVGQRGVAKHQRRTGNL